MKYQILIPARVERQISRIPKQQISAVFDDLEGFADDLDYHRYDVRKIVDSSADLPRYRMRSGNYRVIFFLLHNRLVIEVISIRKKKDGMKY